MRSVSEGTGYKESQEESLSAFSINYTLLLLAEGDSDGCGCFSFKRFLMEFKPEHRCHGLVHLFLILHPVSLWGYTPLTANHFVVKKKIYDLDQIQDLFVRVFYEALE